MLRGIRPQCPRFLRTDLLCGTGVNLLIKDCPTVLLSGMELVCSTPVSSEIPNVGQLTSSRSTCATVYTSKQLEDYRCATARVERPV